jgi:hypothetical protein
LRLWAFGIDLPFGLVRSSSGGSAQRFATLSFITAGVEVLVVSLTGSVRERRGGRSVLSNRLGTIAGIERRAQRWALRAGQAKRSLIP